jgi:putative Holliday junction resolvase
MIIDSLQEFCKFFFNGKKIMAIDYGNKKIGVALSTPDHLICLPYKLISTMNDKEKIQELLTIFTKENICAIVVGLPVNMDGSSSIQTTVTLNFAKELSLVTPLPIFMQDERLTSKLANNLLKTFGLNRKQRGEQDDLTAASLILETTLESVKRLSM